MNHLFKRKNKFLANQNAGAVIIEINGTGIHYDINDKVLNKTIKRGGFIYISYKHYSVR